MTLYEKNPRVVRTLALMGVIIQGVVPSVWQLLRGRPHDAFADIAIAVLAWAVVLGGYEIWLRWRCRHHGEA